MGAERWIKNRLSAFCMIGKVLSYQKKEGFRGRAANIICK